jgi:hypothetical protein
VFFLGLVGQSETHTVKVQNDIIEVDPDTKEMLKALVRILLFYHL